MSRLAEYNSSVVRVIFAGIPLSDGRADPFFDITPNGPAYTIEGPGADGQVTRNATNDNVYTITLTFKGASAELAKLSAIHIADRRATNGAGIASITCEDGNGSTLINTDRAWITQMPPLQFGVNRPDVTVELMAIIEPGQFIAGGN